MVTVVTKKQTASQPRVINGASDMSPWQVSSVSAPPKVERRVHQITEL